MPKNVKINLKNYKGMKKALPGFILGLQKKVAEKAPEKIVASIKAGLSGIDRRKPLPKNEPSTINDKLSRGRGARSLIDDGVLTNPSKWQVLRKWRMYRIMPPAERRKAVFKLQKGIFTKDGRKKKYTILEVGERRLSWVTRIVKPAVKIFLSRFA